MTPAQLIPFPLAKRQGLIRRQAEFFARQPLAAAERNLAHQMEVQRRVLEKKGVAPDLAEAQVAELERAIRGEAHRYVFGGAA